MTISATGVKFDDHSMWVGLSDGRTIGVPFAWFPRLLNATKSERENVEIGRHGLHWSEIDEDISIAGLLAGRRDQTLTMSAELPLSGVKSAIKSQDLGPGLRGRRTSMKKDQLFVERRAEGDYAVRRANSERASAVLPTQAEAIERARELNPESSPLVERVRHTDVGGPDKWRKA
jgi:hypothetical protein